MKNYLTLWLIFYWNNYHNTWSWSRILCPLYQNEPRFIEINIPKGITLGKIKLQITNIQKFRNSAPYLKQLKVATRKPESGIWFLKCDLAEEDKDDCQHTHVCIIKIDCHVPFGLKSHGQRAADRRRIREENNEFKRVWQKCDCFNFQGRNFIEIRWRRKVASLNYKLNFRKDCLQLYSKSTYFRIEITKLTDKKEKVLV